MRSAGNFLSALIFIAYVGLVSGSPAFAASVSGPTNHKVSGPIPNYRDASSVQLAPIPDSQIDLHISRALPLRERQLMHSVMMQILPTTRYNVVYYDLQGIVHVNDPNLLRSVKTYQRSPVDARIGIAADGSTIPLSSGVAPSTSPAYSCTQPPGSFSGGFRAVYSVCNVPYALSYVYLPCKSSGDIFLNYPANEAAYAYEGGFSSTGDAVDAGMQHNWYSDNWAIFFNGDHGIATFNPRFQCNETVPIEFYPASPTLLAVDSTGYTSSGYGTVTETYAVSQLAGWSPQCSRCVVKRITSLAQKGFLNLSDGSYNGIDLNGNPVVRWSNSYVGFWQGKYPVKYSIYSWTGNYTGSYFNYPNDSTKVRVIYSNPGNETDGIWLHS